MIEIEIENLDELERELERGYLRSLERGKKLIRDYTRKTQGSAKTNLESKTIKPSGRLLNSIKVRYLDEGLIGEVFTPVRYAPHVEYGHRLRNNNWWRGYHYMEDAFNYHRPHFERESSNIIKL